MRPDMVVLSEPYVDGCLCLSNSVEPFSVQDFIAKSTIEAFVISILPWASWIDLDGFDVQLHKPFLKCDCDKLFAIIRTNVFRLSMLEQQWLKCIQHVLCAHAGTDFYTQRLVSVFIQHGQHFV